MPAKKVPAAELKRRQSKHAKSARERQRAAPPPASIDPPSWLSEAAREHWDELHAIFSEAEILSHRDGPALAILAETLVSWIEARDAVAEQGLIFTSETGAGYANPLIHVRDKSAERAVKLLVDFGATPRTRGAVPGGKPDEKVSRMSALLGA